LDDPFIYRFAHIWLPKFFKFNRSLMIQILMSAHYTIWYIEIAPGSDKVTTILQWKST